MNKFFIIVNDSSDEAWSRLIWSEVETVASIFNNSISSKSKIMRLIKKIHFSNKINHLIWLPLKSIWNRTLVVQPKDLNEIDRNYLIFHGSIKFSPSYLKKLKQTKNVCVVLYLLDTLEKLQIARSKKELEKYLSRFGVDQVYSFDKADCQKYGFVYFDSYSIIVNDTNFNEKNDICYIGNCRSDSRRQLLLDLANIFKGKCKANIIMNGVADNYIENDSGIKYNLPKTYSEVVAMVCQSNCILELINDNQVGNTLRFKEAICYNKKLLTNNKSIVFSQYYNPDYIHIFSNLEDIECEWISKQENIDYHYQGDFSPQQLLNMIEKQDKNRRGKK